MNLYDEIVDFFNFGANSSLEFKDSQASKSYILKQISTANQIGKMNDLFAMSLFEYVKALPLSTNSAEIYALTEAESIRLTNVVGVPMPVNYDKWLAFLAAGEEASRSALGREDEATWSNVIKDTVEKTVDDIDKKTDPKTNPIPFIIGGLALYLVLRR